MKDNHTAWLQRDIFSANMVVLCEQPLECWQCVGHWALRPDRRDMAGADTLMDCPAVTRSHIVPRCHQNTRTSAVLGVNKFRNAAMLYPSLSPRTNLFLCACVCVYYPEENEAVNTQWNGDWVAAAAGEM